MQTVLVAWMTILSLHSLRAVALSSLDQVCDPRGLSEDPPSCWQGHPQRYLPNVYGGPATLDQCVFGHPKLAHGIFNSCSSGALFGFSGIDGPTNSASKMLGWFVNGSYSVHLFLSNPRFLRLGFGDDTSADPSQDQILIATNDVLLVQRGASKIGVTWRDWSTIVGFIEGPLAQTVTLEERVCDSNGLGSCQNPPFSIRVVNVSTSRGQSLAISTHRETTPVLRTIFAVCYATDAKTALSCATEAASSVDVVAVMAQRNKYILETIPPLSDAGKDRFQRKLLSVMKVNSLAPEGSLPYSWSSADRAADFNMYMWDGMMQTISMNTIDPKLSLDYIRAFLHYQNQTTGQMCSIISPYEKDRQGCSTDAMPPNIALTIWDNYLQQPNKTFLASAFPWLEQYIDWDLNNRRRPVNGTAEYLMAWDNAGEAGMDHEQNFCPGDAYWRGECGPHHHGSAYLHYGLDFTNYVVYESQALGKIATELGLSDRAAHWTSLAVNVTNEMNTLLWDESTGFYYDRYFNGTLMPIKTIAGFYPLLIEGGLIPTGKIARIVAMMKTPDFWTAVPLPTVAVSTADFSSDLDRGPMWLQQNFYVIRGLTLQGYHDEAAELKAKSISIVREYYEKWGVVFEFYDATDVTDPTQTLRKPKKQDTGDCVVGVKGLAGHCGIGGLREYNFCAGLVLRWLRGGH